MKTVSTPQQLAHLPLHKRLVRRLDSLPTWFEFALLIYAGTTGRSLLDGTIFNYHSWQAAAWLQGHLWLPNVQSPMLDLTPYDGHWYSAFPPLPALVMLPFALFWGVDANQIAVSILLGTLNVVLMRLVLRKLAELYPVANTTQCWLTLLFGFGTGVWSGALQGTVWYFAHVCTLTLILLTLLVGIDGSRPLLSGSLIGLAGLARPTVWLLMIFWLIVIYKRGNASPKLRAALPNFIKLAVGPTIAVISLLLYNFIRFGSLTDFGYKTMNVGAGLKPDLAEYGQFHPHFFLQNFNIALLNLPTFHSNAPYLLFDTNGNSLLFVTPAFLLLPLAWRNWQTRWFESWAATLTLGASLASLATFSLLLLYFNTGSIQFGYRFAQDFLPMLIVLLALAWPKTRKGQLITIGLIVLSVLLNSYGTLWFQDWFPNFLGEVKK